LKQKFNRTLLHLRKSRTDLEAEARGEGETLAKHESYLLKFAKENNINIIQIRKELESGEFLVHRPEMLLTLKEIEQGMYDAVLCMDIDRLGRGKKQDQGIILETFKGSSTKIITPRKTYDLSDEWDEEYVDFEQFMAHKELRYINRRLQRGRVSSVEAGNYIGTRAPFGYSIKSEGKGNRFLVPDPEQAPIVQMVFTLYTNDDPNKSIGANKIAAELNRLGYRSSTGRLWERSSIIFMLKNAVYAGRIQWRKKEIKKSITPGKKKDIKTRPKDEWIDVMGKHEPLISMEVFKKAEEILKGKYHVPYQLYSGIVNPLSGLIHCGMCGSMMVRRPYSHQQYPHLICISSNCPNKSSRLDYVENRIIEGLSQWLKNYQLDWSDKPNQQDKNDSIVFHEKNKQKLEKDLLEISEQKGRLHDLLEQGAYDIQTYLERSRVLAERSDTITNTIKELGQTIEQEQLRKTANNEVIPKIENAISLYYKTDDPAKKNALLKSVLNYAEYKKEKRQKDDDFTLVIHPKLSEIPQNEAQ